MALDKPHKPAQCLNAVKPTNYSLRWNIVAIVSACLTLKIRIKQQSSPSDWVFKNQPIIILPYLSYIFSNVCSLLLEKWVCMT